MIVQEKLLHPYEEYTIRTPIWFQCDYCGISFQRTKKDRSKLNKIIDKDSCGSKDCRKLKQQDVCWKLYDAPSRFASSEFKEAAKNSNIEKYGTETYFASDDFKSKRLKSMLDKHGVASPLQNKTILENQKKTVKDLYGVSNYSQHADFLPKVQKKCLEKYGSKSPMQNKDVLNKRDKTCLKKYGTSNYTKTKECKDKKISNSLKKHGVPHPSMLKETRLKAKETCLKRYGKSNYAQTDEWKTRYEKICMEKFGVPNPLCLSDNQKYGKTQRAICKWLNNMGFNFTSKNYKVLKKKEVDLYDENINLAIEYCGLFWHNESSPEPRHKYYHYNKYQGCLENNVRLITIFEDEWKIKEAQCKGFLQSVLKQFDEKLYARNCKLQEINKVQFCKFCDLNHIQGSNNLGIIYFSLSYKDEVVGVISLGRHHRKNDSTLVLDRLCFKIGYQVVGGASKLFKGCLDFAKNNGYKEIISWSDNRWSQGNIYKQLGFILEKDLPPDYSYVNVQRPNKRHSKQSFKDKKGLLTESKWAEENGYARIWDCGKKRWILTI